jgi:putative ABC transport system substrate-binding protein
MGAYLGRSMNNRRGLLVALGAGVLASPIILLAQQRDKVYRIGVLRSDTPAAAKPQMDAFMQGLRELGYVENKNVVFERRYAEGMFDRLPAMAAELVQQKVDLIFVNNTPPALAAKQATATIPIVFAAVGSPIENGVVASLARPGGNITGTTNIATILTGKRLQILREVFPKTSRIAVLNSKTVSPFQFEEVQRAAKVIGLDVLPIELRRREEFEQQIALMRKGRADALYPLDNPINGQLRSLLAEFASQYRLPVIFGSIQYVDAGGLMSYGADLNGNFYRAATYVDKILKGTKPADLPVEQPTKFELAINMKTAKALGITIPQSILVRADRVIE